MTAVRRVLVWLTLVVLAAACSEGAPATTAVPDLSTLAPATTSVTVPSTTQPTPPPTLPVRAPAGLCRSFADPVVTGTIEVAEANEVSGIAASRAHPGVLWVHNDSGGGPFVYATTTSGVAMGTYEIDAATFDWEDMAIGPGPEPGRDYLYLGDIGDNLHFRPVVTIHRIAEPTPDPDGGFIETVEEMNLIYPDPGPDAEAMLVDPITGDLIVITKPGSDGGEATIFRAPAHQLADGATIELIRVGGFPLERGLFVTAADIDQTGRVILFRGYNEVWLWERIDIDFTETFAAEPCSTPSTAEVQGEAITFAAGGYSYYTVSEGSDPDINYVASIFD